MALLVLQKHFDQAADGTRTCTLRNPGECTDQLCYRGPHGPLLRNFDAGVLRIHVIKAENLMKKDVSMIGKGKSDPYAIITVGAQQWKTKHIDNDVNPKWDFWCEARIMQALGQTLDIEVLDKDDGNNDDKLGSRRGIKAPDNTLCSAARDSCKIVRESNGFEF
ncbi:hypothetical protein evm_003843 [Chilo suppressalis]|nr:hypothetical protein evm_003843 [Chilo suppressalis]